MFEVQLSTEIYVVVLGMRFNQIQWLTSSIAGDTHKRYSIISPPLDAFETDGGLLETQKTLLIARYKTIAHVWRVGRSAKIRIHCN